MTTDFRTLCAELTEFVARLTKHYYKPAELLTRARAALANEPAVPEGREPAAVTEQPRPMDEDWDALVNRLWSKYETIGDQGERFMHEGDFCTALDLVRQEIARRGKPAPTPPADGEVAELVAELQSMATDADRRCRFSNAERLTRAAELLQRLSPPQPVPVSERLPGPEDCDAEGKCWWGRDESDDWYADWTLASHKAVVEFCVFSPQTVWLPAHALPVPKVGE